MLNRRNFIKGVISAGAVLGLAHSNPFSKALNCPSARAERQGDLEGVPKVRVIGLGGCGGKTIDYMIRSGIEGMDYILADRDIRPMDSSLIPQLILLETDLSKIRERANDRPSPSFNKDKQRILLALQGSDMVFIIAGLGGGTGTFWAPVVAEICSQLAILNVALVTKPLINGPSHPRRWAEKGIERLSSLADTVIPVDLNEYDCTLSPESDLKGVYDQGHKTIADAVRGITETFHFPGGFIAICLCDIEPLFCKKGLAAFQIGVAEGRDPERKAIRMAIEGLSGRGITLASTQAVLVSFTYNPMFWYRGEFVELTKATELVMKEMDDQADIIWGLTPVETLGEKFRASVFAIGGKYEKPCWVKNIFFQAENNNLKRGLEILAREMDYTIEQGDPFTPDIITFSYFISIVDRNLIGEECWNLFLEFCRETTDDTPLIIVDELRHLKLPDHKNILFVDLNNPEAFAEIKSYIRSIGI